MNKKPEMFSRCNAAVVIAGDVLPFAKKITYENTLNCRRLSSYEFFPLFVHILPHFAAAGLMYVT